MKLTDFPESTWIIVGVVLVIWSAWIVYWAFHRKLGVKPVFASAISMVTVGLATWMAYYDSATHPRVPIINAVWSWLLVWFGVLFLGELYRAWIAEYCSDRERASGVEGIRAWLSPFNVTVLLGLSISMTKSLGWPFLAVLICLLLVLLAFPLSQSGGTGSNAVAERHRVLALLEARSITAEESVRLLNALGTPGATTPSRQSVCWLLGGALVLIGFCLPWARVFPGYIFKQQIGKLGLPQELFGEILPSGPDGGMRIPLMGGDIPHGAGWMILFLGLSAVLTALVRWEISPVLQRLARAILLGLGSVLLGIVIGEFAEVAVFGIFVVLGGYAFLWCGFFCSSRGSA